MYVHPSSAIVSVEDDTTKDRLWIQLADGRLYTILNILGIQIEDELRVRCNIETYSDFRDSKPEWKEPATAELGSYWQNLSSPHQERLGYGLTFKRDVGPKITFLMDALTFLALPIWFREMLSKSTSVIPVTK